MSDLTVLSLKAWLLLACALITRFGFHNKVGAMLILCVAIAYFFARDVVAAAREDR
jgi:hypothetical protein